jgi:S1-C subfamily serine protease
VTLDTEQVIETGRTWKDLPPEPPMGDPLAPAATPPAPPPVAAEVPSRWNWRYLAAILLALIVILLVWLLLPRSEESTPVTTVPASESTDPTETPQQSPVPPAGSTDEPVADVAAALLPSVVQIESGFGIGSGFVYDEAGLIFTAAHVVSGSEEVEVRFSDGRTVTGTVVARDLDQDVAVVAADAGDLVAAPLSGEEVRVGQTAIAVGSPFGLEQSVTVGVVSGLNRSLDVIGRTITGLIQTDAAINVGNSGGPLTDGSGRVVGINIAIASASGGSDGVGFAVPIETALGVADGITSESPPAPVDSSSPLGPLGLDPFGELFGPNSGLGDLDQMLDLFGGLGLIPEGFEDLLGDLDQLGQDLDGLGLDGLGLDGFGLDGLGGDSADTIFELGDLPPGYGATGEQLNTTNDITAQVSTIVGPQGTVTVRATDGADAAASLERADGDVTTVRGQLGKIDTTSSRLTVRWVERGILFEALAPAAVGSEDLLAIVEAMEVTV